MGCFESRDLAAWTNGSGGMAEWPWRTSAAPKSATGLQAPELQAYDFGSDAVSDRASPRDVSRTVQMNGTVNRARRKLEVPDMFPTIGDALEAAQDGDVVRIKNGRYREHIVLQKRVHLLGVGPPQKTIIEAPTPLIWEGSEGMPTVLLQAANARISNLSVVGNASTPAVVENMCGDITIEGCAVRGAGAQTGVRVSDSAAATLRFCDVSECRGHGVAVLRQGHCALEGVHVFRCHCGVMAGDLGSQCALRRCHLQRNAQAGLVVHSAGQALVDESELAANAVAGVALSLEARAVLAQNKIRNNGEAGVCVAGQSVASIRGCDLRGNAGRPIVRSESCEELVELEGSVLDPDPAAELTPKTGAQEKQSSSPPSAGRGGASAQGGLREGAGQRQSSNPPAPHDGSPAASPQRSK